jgi:hypothetical protein
MHGCLRDSYLKVFVWSRRGYFDGWCHCLECYKSYCCGDRRSSCWFDASAINYCTIGVPQPFKLLIYIVIQSIQHWSQTKLSVNFQLLAPHMLAPFYTDPPIIYANLCCDFISI